jgi:hypothetical protein
LGLADNVAYVAVRIGSALVFTFVGWFFLRRIGWARWVLAFTLFLECARVARIITMRHLDFRAFAESLPESLIFLLPSIVACVATILVFWPGRAWFRR